MKLFDDFIVETKKEIKDPWTTRRNAGTKEWEFEGGRNKKEARDNALMRAQERKRGEKDDDGGEVEFRRWMGARKDERKREKDQEAKERSIRRNEKEFNKLAKEGKRQREEGKRQREEDVDAKWAKRGKKLRKEREKSSEKKKSEEKKTKFKDMTWRELGGKIKRAITGKDDSK
jgi:hypothetical protein